MNIPSPFGGAECYQVSTDQIEFRPSERRRSWGWAFWCYRHLTPYGVKLEFYREVIRVAGNP
jgi:hypothetical protein